MAHKCFPACLYVPYVCLLVCLSQLFLLIYYSSTCTRAWLFQSVYLSSVCLSVWCLSVLDRTCVRVFVFISLNIGIFDCLSIDSSVCSFMFVYPSVFATDGFKSQYTMYLSIYTLTSTSMLVWLCLSITVCMSCWQLRFLFVCLSVIRVPPFGTFMCHLSVHPSLHETA